MAEVEETLKRLQSQKGVQGIIVVNTEGIPIKSTMDNPTTTQYANLMHNFILKARSTVREIDPQNDLTFLRIRSKKNEIMVAPGKGSFTHHLETDPHSRFSIAIKKTSHIGICSGPRRA
uniref:Dynein light chain roadblock-type 1 n=1 Tax=Urocitellus parryii TaxID=9999 RepID=A0A8D2H2S1_UROPR